MADHCADICSGVSNLTCSANAVTDREESHYHKVYHECINILTGINSTFVDIYCVVMCCYIYIYQTVMWNKFI